MVLLLIPTLIILSNPSIFHTDYPTWGRAEPFRELGAQGTGQPEWGANPTQDAFAQTLTHTMDNMETPIRLQCMYF